jgi:hypothetical protein
MGVDSANWVFWGLSNKRAKKKKKPNNDPGSPSNEQPMQWMLSSSEQKGGGQLSSDDGCRCVRSGGDGCVDRAKQDEGKSGETGQQQEAVERGV